MSGFPKSYALLSGATFTGPVGFANGTVAAPGLALAADGADTGWYRTGVDEVSYAAGGVLSFTMPAAGGITLVGGPLLTAAGTVGAPAIGWAADADGSGTGFYRSGANEVSVATNGVRGFLVDNVQICYANKLTQLTGGTGLTIGASGAVNLGFWGTAPTTQPTALTQTYATANSTLPNPTIGAAVVATGAALASYGYTQAQANAIVTNLNALQVDVLAVTQFLNAVVDKLQLPGLLT